MRQSSIVNRKGQITIPISIRRSLGIAEGDRVDFLQEGTNVRIVSSGSAESRNVSASDAMSVANRTAGSLSKFAKPEMTIPDRRVAELMARDAGWIERAEKHRIQFADE